MDKTEKSELTYLKGIGPKKAEALAEDGICTYLDLLKYFPRAYIDRDSSPSLKALAVKLRQELSSSFSEGRSMVFRSEVTVVARISNKREIKYGKNRKMLKIMLTDSSGGACEIIFWSFAEYYSKTYQIGQLVTVSGRPELDIYGRINFHHPEIQLFDDEEETQFKAGTILPVYKITEKMKNAHINTRLLRKIMLEVLPIHIIKFHETLPQHLLAELNLPALQESVNALHFPENREMLDKSNYRMKFEEIFFFELLISLRQYGIKNQEKGLMLDTKSPSARKLYDALPFELTKSQKKVINEIAEDFRTGHPMNRLLQGDVGSGKTIVAILAMLMAIDNGYQVAFVAPTEILAEQHFHTLLNMLKGFDLNIIQLIGGQKTKMRREVLSAIANGYANIVVGTHAMFESTVEYNSLGLVIIDEQHRFGVAQRAEIKRLAKKSLKGEDISPHVLIMTATPIPRTLSLTLYGELDVSIIREMPKDRKPIKTKVVFESQLDDVYDFIKKEIAEGHQAYIVFPLVEKSEKMELKSAVEHYEQLQNDVFPEYKCGLLHGQMFWYEKDDSMKAFLNKEFDILIATTVIEVGIDVPNATVMLIQNAERFGLSQLHQLRGRVGRSELQSYCLLATNDNFQYVLNKKTDDEEDLKAAVIRLKTMEETTDGFKISEIDLKLRGPGNILGTKQSGLPDFQFLDLANDGEIIATAKHKAYQIIEQDPHLRNESNSLIKKKFLELYETDNNFIDIA